MESPQQRPPFPMASTSPVGSQQGEAKRRRFASVPSPVGSQDLVDPSSDYALQDASQLDTGLSMATARTANDWVSMSLTTSRKLDFKWSIVAGCWQEEDDPQTAEAATRAAIRLFQEAALATPWHDLPLVVRSTLFATGTSSERGDAVSGHAKRIWLRVPSNLNWKGTKAARDVIKVKQDPFAALRIFFRRPTQSQKTRNHDLIKQLTAASTFTYQGTSPDALCAKMISLRERMEQEKSKDTSVYGAVIPIVQSTGSGKSRLLQEMAYRPPAVADASHPTVATVTLRLGTARTFPPPDPLFVQNILDKADDGDVTRVIVAFLLAIQTELKDGKEPKECQDWLRACGLPSSPQRDEAWRLVREHTYQQAAQVTLDAAVKVLLDTIDASASGSSTIFLAIAVDEAQLLSSRQLNELRRHWAPERQSDGLLTRVMPDRVFLCLAGTHGQLDTIAPLPAASGSGRLAEGSLYLEEPFTALEISKIPPTWDENINPFDLWHHQGRRVWSVLQPQQSREMVERLMSSLHSTEQELPEEDILAVLSQRIVFDLMGPGATKGNYEVSKRLRSLQADQINSKLLWLRQASCRGYELDATTLSEPIPSFWVGLLLSEAPLGWSRVINGLARLLSSLRIVTISAGAIGEILAQILIMMALDQCRFGSLLRKPTVEEARNQSTVSQLDFLKRLVAIDKHTALDRCVDKNGLISAVRFRQVPTAISKIKQADLAKLWHSGEGLVGCPNQPGWDLLLPIKTGKTYSVLVIQVKNHLDAKKWEAKYTCPAAFPELDGSCGVAPILFFLNLNGKRCRADSSVTSVLSLSRRSEEGNQERVSYTYIGNWGAACKTSTIAARVFPVLNEEPGGAAAFAKIIDASFVAAPLTSEEQAILDLTLPSSIA
ncbi:unnamed protein product [Sympodiomycopsis kandeliae]